MNKTLKHIGNYLAFLLGILFLSGSLFFFFCMIFMTIHWNNEACFKHLMSLFINGDLYFTSLMITVFSLSGICLVTKVFFPYNDKHKKQKQVN